ncbi:MAG: hypothetical protein QOH63_2815 [Acidobacteriota bacterium]|jgi:hypothetical protein|nr:hypothetical protein [Acidobacteriota bacterium]
MNHKRLIVVSAENNPYMAWQCKLFHFSCVSRLQQTPLIVVHETGAAELHPDFQELVKVGGRAQRAPSYKLTAKGDIYAPRNTPGSLLHAAETYGSECDSLVLCDPDMIFVRPPEFPTTLSGDYCSYMNYDLDCVEVARQALSISREMIDEQREALRCGVPYVIPVDEARPLAEAWIEAIDAFPARKWEDVMYAFGLAAVKLGLRVTPTRMSQSNYWPDAISKADVVHYCYGDETWSKRHYFRQEQARNVWQPRVESPAGTVLGEILSQLREAEKFYSSF